MHLMVSKECAAQSRDPTNSSCSFHFHTQVLCPPTIPCFSSGNSQFFNIILLWFHSRVTKNKHRKHGEEKMCVLPWLSCFEFYHVVARAITPSSQCWGHSKLIGVARFSSCTSFVGAAVPPEKLSKTIFHILVPNYNSRSCFCLREKGIDYTFET